MRKVRYYPSGLISSNMHSTPATHKNSFDLNRLEWQASSKFLSRLASVKGSPTRLQTQALHTHRQDRKPLIRQGSNPVAFKVTGCQSRVK